MDKDINKLREQTSQYAIEHITGKGMHTGIAWLRDSFNDYFSAISSPNVRTTDEATIGHRQLLAQKIAIDCIHTLDGEQLKRLDGVLDEIARNPAQGRSQRI